MTKRKDVNKAPRVRMNPVARKEMLLNAAGLIAQNEGFAKLTRAALAKATATSPSLMNVYFSGAYGLQREVVAAAVGARNTTILGQAVRANINLEDLCATPRALLREAKAWAREHADA